MWLFENFKHGDIIMNIFYPLSRILNCSAPGPVHESLRETLTQYADKMDYNLEPSFELPGCRPDVFFESTQEKSVFVGDAKDSSNETAGNDQTLERIKKYISAVKNCLKKKQCQYVQFAIATDDKESIDEWKKTLQALFKKSGFVNKNFPFTIFTTFQFKGAWITTGTFELKED